MNAAPNLGQQTDAILQEIGFDSQTIDGWHRTGVI
jgi:crotonobetainyl-CoA:carnitine CoA-transferase CaiB-like acyl-CoA transferase